MATLLIIKTGSARKRVDPQQGDFEHWFARGLAGAGLTVTVCDVTAGQQLPDYLGVAGALVTGSPAMVTERAPWSEAARLWLAHAAGEGMPLLGICYGHQLLADALGGEVGFHPEGREIGSRLLQSLAPAAQDPLFAAMPGEFMANLSHKQSVLVLPPGAVHLVTGDFEPHQVFRWGEQCWGCQFHPEFDGNITRSYVDSLADDMAAEGLNVAALRAQVQDTPEAAGILSRFATLVADKAKPR
ncbi:MAG: glutamine amidotransferase [Halomonadaceae bacterium]|nr:MAG: glutamine amidotransferase [Halomonadaceae bacterium]